MILITGANGHLGTAIIETLISKGIPASGIAALVRDEEKGAQLAAKGVELRIGDYYNYESLVSAFKNIDKLVLVSSGSLQERVQQHKNAIDAAKAAGVKHILYTGISHPNENTKFTPGKDHVATEAMIIESGIPYTFLRNTLYMDVLPMLLGDAINTGSFHLPVGNASVNLLSRNDMAIVAANILATNGHENTVYEIAGAKAYSFDEIAVALSKVAGKEIAYINISLEDFNKGLEQQMPPEYAAVFTGMLAAMQDDEFNFANSNIKDLLGKEPVSLETYLSQVYAVQPA